MMYYPIRKYLELGLQFFNVIQLKLQQIIQYFKEFSFHLIINSIIFYQKHNQLEQFNLMNTNNFESLQLLLSINRIIHIYLAISNFDKIDKKNFKIQDWRFNFINNIFLDFYFKVIYSLFHKDSIEENYIQILGMKLFY